MKFVDRRCDLTVSCLLKPRQDRRKPFLSTKPRHFVASGTLLLAPDRDPRLQQLRVRSIYTAQIFVINIAVSQTVDQRWSEGSQLCAREFGCVCMSLCVGGWVFVRACVCTRVHACVRVGLYAWANETAESPVALPARSPSRPLQSFSQLQ